MLREHRWKPTKLLVTFGNCKLLIPFKKKWSDTGYKSFALAPGTNGHLLSQYIIV